MHIQSVISTLEHDAQMAMLGCLASRQHVRYGLSELVLST
jgi:hypothetical protein